MTPLDHAADVANRSRSCPRCRQLNGPQEPRCFRCGARFPTGAESFVKDKVLGLLGNQFPATKLMVGMCVLVFAIMVAQTGVFPFWSPDREQVLYWNLEALRLGALPLAPGHLSWPAVYSAVFVHFSVLHLGMNAWVCVSFGRHLESMIGGARLIVAFCVTGILGFVLTVLWVTVFGGGGLTAGMSGAVFGLGGTLVGLLKGQGSPHWKQALAQLVGYVVLMAVLFWGGPGGVGVNNSAHAGGLAAGFGLGILLSVELRRGYRRERLFSWVAAALVLLAVLTVVYAYVENPPDGYLDALRRRGGVG